jgi:hypothetical protein
MYILVSLQLVYANWCELGEKIRRSIIGRSSNEARSWGDSKAHSLMVLSYLEALARRAQSNESARLEMR